MEQLYNGKKCDSLLDNHMLYMLGLVSEMRLLGSCLELVHKIGRQDARQ